MTDPMPDYQQIAQVAAFFDQKQHDLRTQLHEAELHAEGIRQKLNEVENLHASLTGFLSRDSHQHGSAPIASPRDNTSAQLRPVATPVPKTTVRRDEAPKKPRRKDTRIMRILAIAHQTPDRTWTVREMTEALGDGEKPTLVRESMEYLRRRSELVKEYSSSGSVRYRPRTAEEASSLRAQGDSGAGIA